MKQRGEFAPAKINLTLEVLGRRADGFHEIRSLVAFAANVGDRLTPLRDRDGRVHVGGHFGGQISGSNLVEAAIAGLRLLAPTAQFPSLRLEKVLPVASGMGGGSADAAAALRIGALQAPKISDSSLHALAARLGSDVPVCLLSKTALMTGRGETVMPGRLPIEVFAVLANPLIRVPLNKTALVFAKLNAPAMRQAGADARGAPLFFAVPELVEYMQQRGNALEKPARELFPAVSAVIKEIARCPGCLTAQLSGAGPTSFGIFESSRSAMEAAQDLVQRHPDWWVKATRLE